MSKRSSRRRRRERRKQKQQQLSGPELVEQGQQAFKQADYEQAIESWLQARNKEDVSPKISQAIAEAYFRQAIHGDDPVSNLQKAIKIQSKENRFHYHLALAYHRQDKLDKAEPIYRQLLAQSPAYQRAAGPLTQLLIERNKAISNDPVWEQLSPAEQSQLFAAEAMVRQKTSSTLQRLLEDETIDPLWRGLLVCDLGKQGNKEQAREFLQTASEKHEGVRQSVAQYYLGTLAIKDDQPEAALEYWQTAQDNGLDSPHLKNNLVALRYQYAFIEQQAGRHEQALKLLETLNNHKLNVNNQNLQDLIRQLNWDMGYQAAQKGDWQQARQRWEMVQKMGDNHRRLFFNLALAYQKTEEHYTAAKHWRTVLRRRPRKNDDPDALTDEQVARIWQAVAENYSTAGDYEEAIKTYKNAVKWAPDNINLRLKLVEAYQTEGRWQAAVNELNRILEKKPDHVPALIMLADSYSDDWVFSRRGQDLWQRILKLEPQNPIARQQLAHIYEQRGSFSVQWGNVKDAIETFKEGLEYVPDSYRLLLSIGMSYARLNDLEETRNYFNQALKVDPENLNVLMTLYLFWLKTEFEAEADLVDIFERIKKLPPKTPLVFFIDLVDYCIDYEQPAQAQQFIELIENRFPNDEIAFLELSRCYEQMGQPHEAIKQLKQLLQINSEHGDAHLILGNLYYELDQTRLGKRYWKQAEMIAKKTNNKILLYQIQQTQNYYIKGIQQPSTPLAMLKNMPPEVLEQLLEDAPPEIAAAIRNMGPEMLARMMADMSLDEEDFYD